MTPDQLARMSPDARVMHAQLLVLQREVWAAVDTLSELVSHA